MYWDSENLDELIRFPIEGSAAELGSPIHFVAKADLNSDEVMEGVNEELRANGFDYAPIRPYRENKYYNVRSKKVLPIADEQYVRHKEVMLYCINILTEYPFAMVVHPDKASWKIVTRADLNTRTAKEYLYSYYSETARAVSELIELEYSADEIQDVYFDARSSGQAIEYWEEASAENVDLHPVEFMSLADLKEVVADTKSIRDELGFPSKTKCREAFDLVEKYRNKTMHGYRTMVLDEDDVIQLAESLEMASDMTVRAGGDEPGFEIPP